MPNPKKFSLILTPAIGRKFYFLYMLINLVLEDINLTFLHYAVFTSS